jgi:hypothetical protein
MILHSMQSAILDDKSSPHAYPRDEIAAQARCAERLNHVEFWQASHRLSEVRELRDACGGGYKYEIYLYSQKIIKSRNVCYFAVVMQLL